MAGKLELMIAMAPDSAVAIRLWLVLFSYLGVAALCAWTSLQLRICFVRSSASAPSAGYIRRRQVWLFASGMLTILAVATTLGWIDAVVQQFRRRAFSDGWYAWRWWVQGLIVAALCVVTMMIVTIVWKRRNEWYRRDQCMLTAFVVFVSCVVVRAVSQHHVDAALGVEVFSVSLWRWVEFAALGLLAGAAVYTMGCRISQRQMHSASRSLRQGRSGRVRLDDVWNHPRRIDGSADGLDQH